MSRRHRWTLRFLVASGILLGLYLARSQILPLAARWLQAGERPRKADYVLVLGGGINSRPFVAAALVRAGLAKQVLVSHVYPSSVVRDGVLPPEDEIVRAVLVRRGVPARCIRILGRNHQTTYDEAHSVADFLDSSPGAQIMIVTSDYHTRRAHWIFVQVLGHRVGQVSFIAAPAGEFQADNWWQHEAGFTAVLGENLKLAFYLVRYSRLPYVGIALALLATAGLWYHFGHRQSAI